MIKLHPTDENSAVTAKVVEGPAGRVILKTGFGSNHIVDMLVDEQLSKIC